MRNNKKFFALVVGALAASAVAATVAASQPHGRRGPGFRGRDGGPMPMLRELDLSEAQRSSIRELFEQARAAESEKRLMEARRALGEAVDNGEADEGAVRELAYQVGLAEGDAAVERIQMRNQLRSLLTAEQVETLDALEAERRQERVERRQRFEERRQKRGDNRDAPQALQR